MKKQKNYRPYLFAGVLTTSTMIVNKFYLKEGFILPIIEYFLILVGLWHLIDRLLSLSHYKWLRWGYMVVGIHVYILIIILLDKYVLHLLMNFTKFNIGDVYSGFLLASVIATIFIESIRWTRERAKAEIENLRLQAANIEANFELLKKQVNPDFLFYCLHKLQMMARVENVQMEDYILKLANVYRQFLKKDKNSHLLQEELMLFQSYMFLVRYGREKTISFEVKVSETLLERKIPVFALQLLADNYIKHFHFSENQALHISVFEKEAQSISITHNYAQKMTADSFNTEQLAMRYAFEGIESGLHIEKEGVIYSTTLSLI